MILLKDIKWFYVESFKFMAHQSKLMTLLQSPKPLFIFLKLQREN